MFNSHQLHRFAIRKYATGVCSVMVASLLFLGTSRVSADQLEAAAEPNTEQVADNPDQLQDQELEAEASGHQAAEANQALANEPVATPATETVIAPTTEPSLPQPLDQVKEPQETKPETVQQASVPATQSVSVAEASKPAEQAVEEVAPVVQEQPASTSKEEKEQVGSALIAKEVSEPQASLTTSRPEPSTLTTNLAPAKFTRGTGFRSFGMTRSATPSGVIGDDYPAKWKHLDPDSHIDDWGMYVRYCTSFVAHRLSSTNKFELPRAYGNAEAWGGRARSEGYTVDNHPSRGSVAWSAASSENWGYGHVAWVAAVNGDMVTVEEYNYGKRNAYNSRTVHKSAFTGYIHFKDLTHGAVASPVPSTPTSSHGLPAQGTYTFTERSGVKNEPKQSSPNRDFYEVGEKVNYDKVLENDNHLWLSYINYSGSRSYVAVKVLTPAPVPQPTPAPAPLPKPVPTPRPTLNLPAQGTYRFTKTLPIKNQSRMASATIDFYYAGETVNYDRVLTAEGRQWLSYLSHSGLRRYVPLT